MQGPGQGQVRTVCTHSPSLVLNNQAGGHASEAVASVPLVVEYSTGHHGGQCGPQVQLQEEEPCTAKKGYLQQRANEDMARGPCKALQGKAVSKHADQQACGLQRKDPVRLVS